jgi:hypothetical protein
MGCRWHMCFTKDPQFGFFFWFFVPVLPNFLEMGLCQLRFACGNLKTSRGQINDPYLLALLATYVYNNKNELINNFNN